jgi:hypothetical protein
MALLQKQASQKLGDHEGERGLEVTWKETIPNVLRAPWLLYARRRVAKHWKPHFPTKWTYVPYNKPRLSPYTVLKSGDGLVISTNIGLQGFRDNGIIKTSTTRTIQFNAAVTLLLFFVLAFLCGCTQRQDVTKWRTFQKAGSSDKQYVTFDPGAK